MKKTDIKFLTFALILSLQLGVASISSAHTQVKFAQNGSATIEYYVDGEGPLILFIASTGRGTKEFSGLAERLANQGFKVLRVEPRGVGHSTGPMEGLTFHDFGNDFAAVIRAEGGGPAIVAGHAYGNWIARVVAVDHPVLTKALVLVAGGAKNWPKYLSDEITMINAPDSTEEQRLSGLRTTFFAPGNDPRPWLNGWHPAVTKSQRAARKLTNKADWWTGGGKVPILDLQGGSDPFRPEPSRLELQEELGRDRVTVQVILNASHALPFEKPIEVADAIAKWATGMNF